MNKNEVFITRKEHFNAAHRLFKEEYSDEKNLEVFGACSNPHWHGHNYTLWVTIAGPIDENTGFVMNLKELSRLIRDHIIEAVDHKNINIEVEFMKGKLASTENLAIAIFDVLKNELLKFPSIRLHCVKLMETENNFVEYFGN